MTARFTPEKALEFDWSSPNALMDAITPANEKYFTGETIARLSAKGLSAMQIAAAFGMGLIDVHRLVNESRQSKTATVPAAANSAEAEPSPPVSDAGTPAAPLNPPTPQELYLKLTGQAAPKGAGGVDLYRLLTQAGATNEELKKAYPGRQLWDLQYQHKKALGKKAAAQEQLKEAAAPEAASPPSPAIASASKRRGARLSTPAQSSAAPKNKNIGVDREAFAEAVADMGNALTILENSRFACASEFTAFFDLFARKLRKLQAMLPGEGRAHESL
jgi:hypothetical protein